jgi:tRNA 2-thiouridine synthesizing protein A
VPTIDARGLACPLPLVLAKRRMAELSPGDTLMVLATDPEAPIDLAAWAADEGHGFSEREAGAYQLKKAGGEAAPANRLPPTALPEP